MDIDATQEHTYMCNHANTKSISNKVCSIPTNAYKNTR